MAYATTTDLDNCGLPPAALARLTTPQKEAALEDNSALADTYMGDKVQLPLVAPYDRSLVRMVCYLAAWDLLGLRGYNPDDPTDAVVARRAEIAIEYFKRIANGQARLNVTQTSPESFQPDVDTPEQRGWGNTNQWTGNEWGS